MSKFWVKVATIPHAVVKVPAADHELISLALQSALTYTLCIEAGVKFIKFTWFTVPATVPVGTVVPLGTRAVSVVTKYWYPLAGTAGADQVIVAVVLVTFVVGSTVGAIQVGVNSILKSSKAIYQGDPEGWLTLIA